MVPWPAMAWHGLAWPGKAYHGQHLLASAVPAAGHCGGGQPENNQAEKTKKKIEELEQKIEENEISRN